MRRKVKNRKQPAPDRKYNSVKVAKFINYVMLNGKKTIAERVVYEALDELAKDAKTDNPLELFETALKNVGPTVEVRSRRVGGANYQVPRDVRPERRMQLAMRWILEAARSGKGKPIAQKLAAELKLAANDEGAAVKKRENAHKMAEANKAFAHFSW
jgi:small subunit ribosomal protein S7